MLARSLVLSRPLLLAAILLFISPVLRAQDAFEIQVYEYDLVPKRMWNLETHLNYTARGTKAFEGTVAPTENQFHLTYELTRGITDVFELAGYLVLAARPDGPRPLEYAGWRIRPRVAIPKSWGLPLDVSISGEVGFPRGLYEENSTTLEIRPIVEKKWGRWQFDGNPVLARALRGPGAKEGWEFEPAVRIAYEATKKLDLSLEYYGATGPFSDPLPRNQQTHQFYPGGDFKLTENIVWNFGIGVGATHSGNRLVYKSRIGMLFGR